MKKLILLALVAIGACSPKEKAVDSNISLVESSLGPNVYFEGDSLWNIEDRMKHYGIPGASIAVIKDNKIVWVKAYGVMDLETNEPVTTTTLFQAASISKPVSGYGVLRTVESGKINLTDDVNTWLKTWKLPDNEFTKDRKVNVADLLSHTGGITVHGFRGYSAGLEQVPALLQVLDGIQPPANSPAIRVDKVPGGSFRYSGGGYCILQQMMIDVYGKSFPEIQQELVLGPLAMSNSSFDQPLDSLKLKRAATGYLPNGEQTKGKRHTYPELAAAGLWTTPEDLAKFAIDIQQTLKGESKKVISKKMADKMLTKVNDGMGLSMGVNDIDGALYFGHGGWNEGFSSQVFASRDRGYGVVVMINKNKPEFITEVIHAVGKVYNWANIPPTYKAIAMDTTMFAKFRGRYNNSSDGRIIITSKGDKLYMKKLRAKESRELVRVGENTYVPRYDNDPIQFIDSKIVFTNNPKEDHSKVGDEEFVPYEYLLKGDYKKALTGYKDLQKKDPQDRSVNEENLNQQGYDMLQSNQIELALNIFRINTELYPNSANTFDSYADALKQKGDTKEAIANYKKALKLNPQSKETAAKLAELENVSKK